MTHVQVFLILYAVGVAMSGISAWTARRILLTTRGSVALAVFCTFVPVINYIVAVAFMIEGNWGSKEVNWE